MDKIFTADEMYLIESTFDYLYSLLDEKFFKISEQVMIFPIIDKDMSDEDKAYFKKKYVEQAFRLGSSAELHRSISKKCEDIRKGVNNG
jgi:hypothetical protein